MPQLLIHSESGETSSLSVADDTVTIGRRRSNSLCLPHLSVSGHHARIVQENGCLILEDLDSTNGTLVNDKQVQRQVLVHLDDIIIGSYSISYSETYTQPVQSRVAENVTALTSIVPIIDPSLETQLGFATDPRLAKDPTSVAMIKVHSGNKAGSVVVLEKPITTIGRAGGSLGAISKKSTGYYFIPVNDRNSPITHNGRGMMEQVEVKLAGGDQIEIEGQQLEFVYPSSA